MKNPEHPELEPIDITGEVVPDPENYWQTLVDQGLGFWSEDGEFCSIPPRDIYEQ